MSSRAEVAGDLRWSLFTSTWAAAVLFHIVGNPVTEHRWVLAAMGVSALLVLSRPSAIGPPLVLAVSVLVGVWEEAPQLGNHWLVHGFIALIVLGSAARAGTATRAHESLLWPARLTLLAFYGFAAFAKLNADFFDPAVSCAGYYLEESARSWGLGALTDLPDPSLRMVAIAVASIELSVPALLLIRRTRVVGVLVGLGFHFLLALDRSHEFFDFSALLVCLFLLFLPPDAIEGLGRQFGRARAGLEAQLASGPELLRMLSLALGVLIVALVAGPGRLRASPTTLRDTGLILWLVLGLVVIASVIGAVRGGVALEPRAVSRSWLLLVPALAVANGLTPYLEVKTGTSWNMYSNLAVIEGDSNHLLIRRGLPLTDAHERLVRVEASNDEGLRSYDGEPWVIPEVQLIDYLAERPDIWARGEVDGRSVTYRGSALGDRGRSEWRQRLQVFRAVDADGPVSCQPFWAPAS